MIEFLSFSEETRRQLIDQVNTATGIGQNAIEKDWWVTLMLKALFSLPMSEHFTFKGGTSLSKGWGMIKRFSEDIDIALAPEAFGKVYMPDATTSYVKRLKRFGCKYTSTEIFEALKVRLQEIGVPDGMLTFEVEPVKPDMPDKDPQSIFIHYPPLFEPSVYMLPKVKIEFGVRALREPFSTRKIKSILATERDFPGYKEEPFNVSAVEPRKTFMEKMILLHEKYQTGALDDLNAERQSRHLSDLFGMGQRGIANEVQDDTALYETLIVHRRVYVGHRNTDYSRMQLSELKFVPPFHLLKPFRDDYQVMREEMLYGETPDFDEMIGHLRELNMAFVSHGLDCNIKELIDDSIRNLAVVDKQQNVIVSRVNLYSKNLEQSDREEILATFEIELIMINEKLVFHRMIRIA